MLFRVQWIYTFVVVWLAEAKYGALFPVGGGINWDLAEFYGWLCLALVVGGILKSFLQEFFEWWQFGRGGR